MGGLGGIIYVGGDYKRVETVKGRIKCVGGDYTSGRRLCE